MKIYLINLDRHPERLAHMRTQLDGVAFERISAVDGSTRPATMQGLTRFELACLESHRTAWRKFLASAESLACFLEDDLHIQPGFAALLSEARWPPKDAHSVKLDTYFQKVRLGERLSASGGREIARLYSRHESAAAYILSRDGATRYLELTESARPARRLRGLPEQSAALGSQHLSARSGYRNSGSSPQGRQKLRDRDDQDRRRSRSGPFIACRETGARERATREPFLEPWRVGLSEGDFAGRDDDSRT